MSQKLRGLVAQSMSGQKKAVTALQRSYGPGSYTFTVPQSGIYRFVMWGGGGAGGSTAGGGSGAFIIAERALGAGWQIPIVVGAGGPGDATGTLHGGPGTASSVTLPDGTVLTAGAGTNGAPTNNAGVGGTATINRGLPADILLNGSAGGTTANASSGAGSDGGAGGSFAGGANAGGGGAPGTNGYRGGDGGTGNTISSGRSPGAGGGFINTVSQSNAGGDGLVLVTQVRVRR